MTKTKQYDYLNRLKQISSSPSASFVSPLTYNYNYNPANQRTKDTLADGSYWVYGYDSLGQVTNACKYWANGSPVAGQQFDYIFDTIGNRTQTQAGRRQESHSGRDKREHGERAAERNLREGMARLGLTEESLGQGRKVTPEKAALAWWLRERTTVSLRWVSERLAMGHYSNAGRGPRKLKAADERQRRRAMAKLKGIA